MPLYEHIFLARQDISSQQVEALTEGFQALITEAGGTIAKAEYWGLKTLAYKIKKNRKAHFSLLNIDAPHAAVAEMERQMRISTEVLRFMTVRVDAHDPNPSPILRRPERDDRRGGRRDHGGRHSRFGAREGRGGRDGPRGGPREGRDGPPREPRDGPRENRSAPKAAPAGDKE